MARFAAQQSVANASPITTNAAGGTAFVQTPKLELASLVLTSLLKDRHHQSADDDLVRARALVAQLAVDDAGGQFCAKAALYARHKHGLRSISHVVAGELGNYCRTAPWRRRFYDKIVFRPDDACEIVAYWMSQKKDKRLPNAMIRGLAKRLARFDGYQLAKYKGGGKALSLVDVVNLTHPKGPAGSPIAQLMKGTLKSADTWETALSKAGAQADVDVDEAKSQEWERLLAEGKLGYLATLRNLRNIMESGNAKALQLAHAVLVDEDKVRKAKVFPFQFTKALDAIRMDVSPSAADTRQALNIAVELSVQNVPKFDGKTLIAVDASGSMSGDPIRIASLFAAVIAKANPLSQLMLFSDDAIPVGWVPGTPVLVLAELIAKHANGGGTNFNAIFQRTPVAFDRIIILSDMQAWVGGGAPTEALADYKRRAKCDPFIHSFDLNGHGTSQFLGNKTLALAGWSDKCFEVMALLETDRNALVHEIEKTEL